MVIFGSGFEDSLLLALTKKKLLPSMRIMTWSHASYDNYFTNMGAFFSRYMKEAIKAYYHVSMKSSSCLTGTKKNSRKNIIFPPAGFTTPTR